MIALLPYIGSSKRPRTQSATLAALGMACAVVIMVLHGHECSGDGCLLCLTAAWAHTLLCLCVGLSIARPAVRVLMHARIVLTLRIPWRDALPLGKYPTKPQLPAATPLSMGVMLRI